MKIGALGSSVFRKDGRYTGTRDVAWVSLVTLWDVTTFLYVLNQFFSANVFKKMTWWKGNFIISVQLLLWKFRVKNEFSCWQDSIQGINFIHRKILRNLQDHSRHWSRHLACGWANKYGDFSCEPLR